MKYRPADPGNRIQLRKGRQQFIVFLSGGRMVGGNSNRVHTSTALCSRFNDYRN